MTMKRANRQENCGPEIVYDIRQNIDAIIEGFATHFEVCNRTKLKDRWDGMPG